MDIILLLQYLASLLVLGFVIYGLSRLKQALLRCCRKMQNKPPSLS